MQVRDTGLTTDIGGRKFWASGLRHGCDYMSEIMSCDSV